MKPALLSVSLLMSAATSQPAIAAAYYGAQPAAAPMSDRIITRSAIWNRAGANFVAAKSDSRPAIVCQTLAKEVGALASFTIAGTPISVEDLEKCNAKARS